MDKNKEIEKKQPIHSSSRYSLIKQIAEKYGVEIE